MNVDIGAEAALSPEKEYMSGIFIAVLTVRNTLWSFQNGPTLYVSFQYLAGPSAYLDSEEYALIFQKNGSTLYALFQYLAGPWAWKWGIRTNLSKMAPPY